MSSSINICKFIFAILICLLHCSMLLMWRPFGNQPWGLFQSGYIFVEWFYIFAGFTLAKSILDANENNGLVKNSLKIFIKRFTRIYPIFLISIVIGLILRYHFGTYKIENTESVLKFLCELFTIRMFVPPSEVSIIGTDWFLSSMWLAFIIVIPFGLKFKRHMFKLAFFIASIIYLYIYIMTKNLYSPLYVTSIGIYKGNLRAVAGIMLGFFGYEVNLRLKDFKFEKKIFSLIIIVLNMAVILYTIFVQDSPFYFLLPYVFLILIIIQMKTEFIISDSSFTRFLGEISAIILFSHNYVINIVDVEFKEMEMPYKLTFLFIIILLISIVIYVLNAIFDKNEKITIS